MLSAEQFLAILEQKDLLPRELLEELHQQIRQSRKPVGAATVAQRLIRQKLLTPVVVERLFAAAGETAESVLVPPQFKQDDEDLGLAPLDDQPPPGQRKVRKNAADDLDLAPLDDEPHGKSEGGKAVSAAKRAPGAPPPKPSRPSNRSLLDEELAPLDSTGKAPMDALMSGGAMADAAEGDLLSPKGPRKRGLRRFFRDLFRRKPGPRNVVFVKSEDPRKVILLLSTWGGTVLLLFIVCGVFWYFSAPSSMKMLDTADTAYQAGQYAEAIDRYNAFLEEYPNMEQTSQVHVRIGLAQLRLAAQQAQEGGDWSESFETAREVLRAVQTEPAFKSKENQEEIGVAIAVIAEGLARQSREQPDADVVGRARAAIGMVEINFPQNARPVDKLAEINQILVASERRVARDRAVDETIGRIKEAIAKGNALSAYNERNKVVQQYPDVADHPTLEEALAGAASLLQAATKVVREVGSAETAERPSDILATVVLASRLAKGEAKGARGLLFAIADGAVYALDRTSGTVVWRRFISASAAGQSPVLAPVPLSRDPLADVAVCDPLHREVLRIDGPTGRLIWRHALPAAFAVQPVLAGNRLLVPTEDSRLVLIDLLSGQSSSHVQLPQPCHVTATVDDERSLIYQVADQSILYVLSAINGECRQVFHLGHEPGTVAAPPVIAGDLLLVGINGRTKDSSLRVLKLSRPAETAPGELVTPVQQIGLKGQIKTAPVAAGRRVVVVTAQGIIQVLGLDPQSARPLTLLTRSEPKVEEELPRFPLLLREQLWLADTQLAQYDVRGRIVPRQFTDHGFTFLQPLLAADRVIFHVRRKPRMPGVTVSAVTADKHEVLWQKLLATPLAGDLLVDAGKSKLTAVTMAGGMFPLEASIIKGRNVTEDPYISIEATKMLQPVREVVPMPGGMFAMTSGAGATDILLYDPAEPLKRFRYLLSPRPMTSAPLPLAGGLLAPCNDGTVALLDPKNIGKLAEPFQPKVASVTAWNWPPAAAFEKDAILCDGEKRLYRMTIQGDPPEVTAAAEVRTDRAIRSPVAVLENVAYLVDDGGAALTFSLPGLAAGKQHALEGHAAWGPRRIGPCVLVATDKDRLYAFNERQELAWQIPLPYGPLAGTPWAANGSYYLASARGTIWRVAAASGDEQGKVEAGVPLGSGPVLIGERLFVAGHDGTLYEIKRP